MNNHEDNDIRALIGAVVSELLKIGEPVQFHQITDALFRLSQDSRDKRFKVLCQRAIHFFSLKMH
ncbi:hypothetical protein [Pantoea ananatis]|uniref:hypothetical protein n=1 Tax=Pantoea ananas TaxID=553 RepID=UPI000CF44FDB|nr:hypothetical protein [Pantoea ananatis]PQK86403.1 hypothetical protein CG432_15640 [Pantoea ananatis]PWV89793.1 hypothetical protein C7426_103128 [Pantoea ananatis]REC90545.1 hypothetical protein C7423_10697 [Pantoea ananatis]